MPPLADGLPARRFPIVNVAIIPANFAVWLWDPSSATCFYPTSRVLGLIGIFPVRISAWFFLGFWFLYQLFEANFGLFGASAHGGGVAFFAHVGGFVFGFVVAWLLANSGRLNMRSDDPRALGAPA